MAYTATHKYARISARKVRHLASLVRGKFADEALDILRFQPHRGARMLEKVIKSALGNAEHQQAPGVDDLVVVETRPADNDVVEYPVVLQRHSRLAGANRRVGLEVRNDPLGGSGETKIAVAEHIVGKHNAI